MQAAPGTGYQILRWKSLSTILRYSFFTIVRYYIFLEDLKAVIGTITFKKYIFIICVK